MRLRRSLSQLKDLSKLSMDFAGCTAVGNLDEFLHYLEEIKNISTLSLTAPDGANVGIKQRAMPKAQPEPKPEPKQKQVFSSVTAKAAWAKPRPKPKSRP